jgi:endonuclease/exonuclease/phosphatase (EEP) superfamily protein YafD
MVAAMMWEVTKVIRTIWRKLLNVPRAGLLVILALGFCGAFSQLSDSFAHFRLHAGLGLACVALLFGFNRLLVRSSIAAVGAISACAMSYPALPYMAPNDDHVVQGLKLVQFNVLYRNQTIELAADWVKQQKPDFVTLQEVTADQRVATALTPELPYALTCDDRGVCRIPVMSRFPLLQQRCLDHEGLAWMQVKTPQGMLTVASLHMHSPYPFEQWPQLAKIEKEPVTLPKPVVLGGDFNAAPWSAATRFVERTGGALTIPACGSHTSGRSPIYGICLTSRLSAFPCCRSSMSYSTKSSAPWT